MISHPSIARKLPNFPRKASSFFGGWRYGDKYYSKNYKTEIKAIHSEFPKSVDASLLSVKIDLYSNEFSVDCFGRDCIRVHEAVLRICSISMKVVPVGFHIYFDAESSRVRSSFFFLNFNRIAQAEAFKGQVPLEQSKELLSKIKERVGSHYSFSFTKMNATDEVSPNPQSLQSPASTASVANNLLGDVVSVFGDEECRVALNRALRGLPLRKAQRMVDSLNKIMAASGDNSARPLEIPKTKPTKGQPEMMIDRRQSESFLAYMGIDEVFP